MKSPVKYIALRLLITFVFILIPACVIVLAADSNQEPGEKEVLTTLQQRMQKKISVDFRNTPVDDVVRIMAEQADVDIIKSPKVIGDVTATLTDVPLEEALNSILASHGFGYVVGKSVIRVAPLAEITERAENLDSRIYRITYADVTEVEKALQKFISSRGSLSSNPGTSNIIVTDTESKIKAIDTFIGEIDRITPQILVEARIYDITSKDRLDLGVEWQAGRDTSYGTSGITTIGTNPTKDRDPFITGLFNGTTNNTDTTTAALRLGWLNAGIDIDVLLKAEKEDINATLLANPRILVLDNKTAVIKIIEELAFQELTETSGGGSFATTEFREVGVELQVTPHLTRDEMIRLSLKPKFSINTGDVQTGTSGFPQPIIDRREADTTLLIKNGQTVVLGGLRKKDVSQQTNKIPLLGDLPLVGGLFKFEGEETITSELVVFITPRIIETPLLSAAEMQQLGVTDFEGPAPAATKAEGTKK
jgi:type IV pilus assembly protein PilQ